MREEPVRTFEEFEEKATALLEDRKKRSETRGYFSPVLFRGQAQASWKLKTTLEQCSTKQYSLEDYYIVMRSIRSEVESCTGRRWDFPSHYSNEKDAIPNAPQGYPFMAYLRHHGFPSPLLDWTRSFYVAAFFAFQSSEGNDLNAAIYSFIEYPGTEKVGWKDQATIVGVGPYLTTHERHFRQQSQYTFCKKSLGDRYVYCSHEEAFARNNDGQDVLTKFVIPKTERVNVLDKLHMMNITAYSLFGSEESLLAYMAYKEIE
jgi:hypothetical protein